MDRMMVHPAPYGFPMELLDRTEHRATLNQTAQVQQPRWALKAIGHISNRPTHQSQKPLHKRNKGTMTMPVKLVCQDTPTHERGLKWFPVSKESTNVKMEEVEDRTVFVATEVCKRLTL